MSVVQKQANNKEDNLQYYTSFYQQSSQRNGQQLQQEKSLQNTNTKEANNHQRQVSKELLDSKLNPETEQINTTLNTQQKQDQNSNCEDPYDQWLKDIPNPTKNQIESKDQQVFKQRPQINISLDEHSKSFRFLQRIIMKFQDFFMRQHKYTKQISLNVRENSNIPISEVEEKILDDVRELIEPQAEWAREIYGDKYFYHKKVALRNQIKNISNCFDRMLNIDFDNSIFFVEEGFSEQKKIDCPTLAQIGIYLNCKQALDTQQVQFSFVLITLGQTLPKSFEKHYKRLFKRFNFKLIIIHILDIEEKQFQNTQILQRNVQKKHQFQQNDLGSCSSISEIGSQNGDHINQNSNYLSNMQSMYMNQSKMQSQYASNLFKSQPILNDTKSCQSEKYPQNFKVYNIYLRNKNFENVRVSSKEFIHLMERHIFPFLRNIKIDIMVFEYDFSFSEDVSQKVVLKTYVLAYIIQKLKEISKDKLLICYIIRQLKTSIDCCNQSINKLSHLLDLKNNIKQKVMPKSLKARNELQNMKIYFEYSLQIQDSIRKTLLAVGQLINFSKYIQQKQTDFNFHPCLQFVKNIRQQSNQFLSYSLQFVKDYSKIAQLRNIFVQQQLTSNQQQSQIQDEKKQPRRYLNHKQDAKKHKQNNESKQMKKLNNKQISKNENNFQDIDLNQVNGNGNFSDQKLVFSFPQTVKFPFSQLNSTDSQMLQNHSNLNWIDNQQMQSSLNQFNYQNERSNTNNQMSYNSIYSNQNEFQQNQLYDLNLIQLVHQQNRQDKFNQVQTLQVPTDNFHSNQDDSFIEHSSSLYEKSSSQQMHIKLPSLDEHKNTIIYRGLIGKIPVQQLAKKNNIDYGNFLQLNEEQKQLRIINQIKQKQGDFKLKDSVYHILWEKSCKLEIANPSKDFNLKIFYFDEHSQYLVNYQQSPNQADKIAETKMIIYFFNVRSKDCYNNYILQQITGQHEDQQKFNIFKLKYNIQSIQFIRISDLDAKINEQNQLKEQLQNAKHTINVNKQKIEEIEKNGLSNSQICKQYPSDLNSSTHADLQGTQENNDSQKSNNSLKISTKIEEKKVQTAISNYQKIITEMDKKVIELEKKIEEIQCELKGTVKKDENDPINIQKIEGLEEKKIDLSALCIIESSLVETEEYIFKFFGRALNIRVLEPLVLKQEIKLIMRINKFDCQKNNNLGIEILDPEFNFEQYKEIVNEFKQLQQQQNNNQNPQNQQSQRMSSRPDQSQQNSADSQLKMQQSQLKPQGRENQSSQSLLTGKQNIDNQGQNEVSKNKQSQMNQVDNQKIIQSPQINQIKDLKNNSFNQNQEQKANSQTDQSHQQYLDKKQFQIPEQRPLVRTQHKQEENQEKSSQLVQNKQQQQQQQQKHQQLSSSSQQIQKNNQDDDNNNQSKSLNSLKIPESQLNSRMFQNSQRIQDEAQLKIYQQSFQKKFFRGRFGASGFYFNNKIYIFNGYSQQFMEETSMIVFVPEKLNDNNNSLTGPKTSKLNNEAINQDEQSKQDQMQQELSNMLFYFVMKVSIGKASIKGGYGTFMLPLLRSEAKPKHKQQPDLSQQTTMDDENNHIQQPNKKKLVSYKSILELQKNVKNLLMFSFESFDCQSDLKKQFIKIQVFNPIQKQVLIEKKVSLFSVFTLNQPDNPNDKFFLNILDFFDQPFQNILNVANRNNNLNEFYYELNNDLFYSFVAENFRASKLFVQIQINITQISKYFSELPKSSESLLERSIQIQIINS
ncbi:hypothetical protein ABPG74_007915 [Tetrahymena malaccensis]